MKRLLVGTLLVAILALTGCTAGGVYIPPTLTPAPGESNPSSPTQPSAESNVPSGTVTAVIKTPRGDITCQLRPDAAPKTVENFTKLANEKWFDGHTFFRVEPGFVIQGGSPNDTASGDIGYTVPAEIELKHQPGAIATARTGDQVNPKRESSGSQFYITLGQTPSLDGAYTVFGYCGPMDVISAIQKGDAMTSVRVTTK